MKEYKEEFIGKKIVVEQSKNKALHGIEGKIIDETMNAFTVRTKEKNVMILKKGNLFMINGKKIDGDKIIKRPEDRIRIKGK